MMRKHAMLAAALIALAASSVYAQDKPDALELYRAGKYEEAVTVCQQELAETPKNIDSHVVLCWSYLKLKKYQDALQDAQKGLVIAPNDSRLIQVIGEAYFFLGKISEALQNLEEYVALQPSGSRIARVYWLMGECYISLREYQNADMALSTALYYEQSTPSWWARLGYAKEMAGDARGASESYSRALKLDPGLTDAVRGIERVDKILGG